MAIDKAVDSAALDSQLKTVADAIRSKGGTSAKLAFPTGFSNAIKAIPTGGGLPTGISAFDFGVINVTSPITSTAVTYSHKLGVTPDFVMVWHNGNIESNNTMLWSFRSPHFGYRNSGYNMFYGYHGSSTTTVSTANSNYTNYGVNGFTATTFKLASGSNNGTYAWAVGDYNYIAIKFA